MEEFGTLVTDYLASRGRDFSEEVKRKQARQLGVTAFLEEVSRVTRLWDRCDRRPLCQRPSSSPGNCATWLATDGPGTRFRTQSRDDHCRHEGVARSHQGRFRRLQRLSDITCRYPVSTICLCRTRLDRISKFTFLRQTGSQRQPLLFRQMIDSPLPARPVTP